jgi:AraC-like DNA-binding protein
MKKLELLKVTAGAEYSFSFLKEDRAYFYDQFHYHRQLELNLILKGKGTRFVGDSIERFNDGDLILIGTNLPHVWRSDKEYYGEQKRLKCTAVTVHFAYDFLGENFFSRPEFRKINELLTRSTGGIKLTSKIRDDVAGLLKRMVNQNQTERLITLLDILNKISLSKGLKILSSQNIQNAYKPTDSDRIRKVHQYIVTNFRDQVRLEDVAKTANMSTTAFCRYFRQRTRKTFSNFLTEVRIGYACQLLQEKKMKVAEVCYESGYSNLSNFNKQFKSIKRVTPNAYRKMVQ